MEKEGEREGERRWFENVGTVICYISTTIFCRVGKLEGDVLLVEKEKALADLKTIRKANKHMEK